MSFARNRGLRAYRKDESSLRPRAGGEHAVPTQSANMVTGLQDLGGSLRAAVAV
jgi:hypothetical protein